MGWYLFVGLACFFVGFINGCSLMTTKIKKDAKNTMSIEIDGKLYKLKQWMINEIEKEHVL